MQLTKLLLCMIIIFVDVKVFPATNKNILVGMQRGSIDLSGHDDFFHFVESVEIIEGNTVTIADGEHGLVGGHFYADRCLVKLKLVNAGGRSTIPESNSFVLRSTHKLLIIQIGESNMTNGVGVAGKLEWARVNVIEIEQSNQFLIAPGEQ